MKNLTLAIDDTLLERSRELAAKRGITLNAMVRGLLSDTIEKDDRVARAKQGMKRLMETSLGTLPPDYKWNREEIYAEREDRLLSRLEHPDSRGGGESE